MMEYCFNCIKIYEMSTSFNNNVIITTGNLWFYKRSEKLSHCVTIKLHAVITR